MFSSRLLKFNNIRMNFSNITSNRLIKNNTFPLRKINTLASENKTDWYKVVRKLTMIFSFPVVNAVSYIEVKCKDIDEENRKLKFFNEDNLTHLEQIKRASSIAVESGILLFNRCILAYLDIAKTYEKQLAEINELYELCIKVIEKEDQHNIVWDAILSRRGELNLNKQTLKDLELGLEYAERVLDNAIFSSCLVEDNYSMIFANQIIETAHNKIKELDDNIQILEQDYNKIQAEHIKATTKLAEEVENKKETPENKETNETPENNKENNYVKADPILTPITENPPFEFEKSIQDSSTDDTKEENVISKNISIEQKPSTLRFYSETLSEDTKEETKTDSTDSNEKFTPFSFPFETGKNFISGENE